MSNFLQRALTGTVYVGLIVASVYTHPIVFFLVYAFVMVMSLFEFYKLTSLKSNIAPHAIPAIFMGIGVFALSFITSFQFIAEKYLVLAMVVPFLLMILELFRNVEQPFHNVAYTLTGMVYVVLPFSVLPFMAYNSVQNTILSEIVLSMFILIWANDTFAYLWGVTLGKHKLFPRISPKKSVEGFVGGLLSSVGISVLIALYFAPSLSLFEWVGGAIVIVVFATLGDLVESMLKRFVEVKDSSNMLPGHGGFLDRFDSVLFCLPAFYTYLICIH